MKKLLMIITLVLIIVIAGITGVFDNTLAYIDSPGIGREKTVREQFSDLDYEALGIEAELWEALLDEAEKDDRLVMVLENIELYPGDMIKLSVINPEARDFVSNYPGYINSDNSPSDIKLDDSEITGGLQLLTQWDKRWGYDSYGGKQLGITGCGPTCLSMVALALTGDTSQNPLAVARMAENSGYYVEGSGSSWDLMRDGAVSLGLTWREIGLSEDLMREVLSTGEYIICSVLPGDFTTSGHFIILDGYENGEFTIKDPNSPMLSERGWSYDELAPQLAAMWAYSAA